MHSYKLVLLIFKNFFFNYKKIKLIMFLMLGFFYYILFITKVFCKGGGRNFL